MRYLLDASVLIPLVSPEHVHHERAVAWAQWLRSPDSAALCPVVEGALIRFAVRLGAAAGDARAVLVAIRDRLGAESWHDDLTYADVDLSRVHGHRQVTDAYLVGLARLHGGVLATLDEALAADYGASALLLP